MKSKLLTALASSIVIALLACPFLASPIGDIASGVMPDASVFPPEPNATAVSSWWLSGAFGAHLAGTALTFLLALCICSLMAYSSSLKSRADDGGVLGNAHIKTGREAVKGSITWDGFTNPSSRGFVYGFTKWHGKPCYLFEPKKMVYVSGATGSGKSRFLYLPSIDLLTYGDGSNGSEPATLVVSDVKDELIELTGDELARRGYRVLLLDTQHPYRGQRFNPLKRVLDLHIKSRDQEAEQAADTIAELVVQDDEKGKGSHWTASARGLLSAIVLLVSMSDECPEESKQLATVCEVLDRGTEAEGDDPAEPLKDVFRALPSRHPAKNRASQFVSSGGNELRSILSTLKVALRPFSSAPVAWMTSGSDIDPRAVLEAKSAVFLHVLDEGSPYNCIAAIFLSQLWESVQNVADSNGGSLPRPVQILGDEWGNLPRIECLPALLSLGRSFQIYWTGATQDISQLNKYGERDGRRKILANCGVKVAMKLAEEEDRRYFTELIGKTTRHTQGTSSSKAASGSSASTSYSESADDVIHAWEWRDMAPDRNGIIVVKHADNGMPAAHAGAFRTPVADCTKTPTKEHFDLGTPEHETEKRRAYQKQLDEAAAEKMGERVGLWCPKWPEPKKKAEIQPTGKFSGLSLD